MELKPADNEFTLNTDDTVLVLGALLATAINLVRDPDQGKAYGGDPEAFLLLADRIGSAFVQAASEIATAHPELIEQALIDCRDVSQIMTSGFQAYESYRPIVATAEDSFDAAFNALRLDRN